MHMQSLKQNPSLCPFRDGYYHGVGGILAYPVAQLPTGLEVLKALH